MDTTAVGSLDRLSCAKDTHALLDRPLADGAALHLRMPGACVTRGEVTARTKCNRLWGAAADDALILRLLQLLLVLLASMERRLQLTLEPPRLTQ